MLQMKGILTKILFVDVTAGASFGSIHRRPLHHTEVLIEKPITLHIYDVLSVTQNNPK